MNQAFPYIKMQQDRHVFASQIQRMFSDIAPRYDFLNRLLSGGRDRHWRRVAVDCLGPKAGERFVDLATGTAEVALEIASRDPGRIKVLGVDFSLNMLALAKKKVGARKLAHSIQFQSAAAEYLPIADSCFDGVISAFGVRNFSDRELALREMWRVLNAEGKVVILEFSLPRNRLFKFIYRFYFDRLLPWVGGIISRHPGAYSYLPTSVGGFPLPEEFVGLLESAGFVDVTYKNLTLGIATVYSGVKHA